jgi:hypothetical protein
MMNSSNFPDSERHVPVRIDYSRARKKYAEGGAVSSGVRRTQMSGYADGGGAWRDKLDEFLTRRPRRDQVLESLVQRAPMTGSPDDYMDPRPGPSGQMTEGELRYLMQNMRGYEKGGLAKKAQDVRGAGRMGDDMVVHVNKREFEEMRKRWGEPTINPHTKMPEFFLGDLFSGVGNLVTSGASYLPVVGESVSGWLASNPGAAQAIGSGLLGAGAGQLLGGNTKSTLIGAGLGALAPTLLGGASLFGGAAGAGPGGAQGDGPRGMVTGDDNSLPRNLTGAVKAGVGDGGKKAVAGIIGALTLASLMGGAKGPNAAQKQAAQAAKDAQERFNAPLPAMQFQRALNPYMGNPLQYGFGGANGMGSWFTGNQVPRRVNEVQGQLARGGRVAGYAGGGALSAMHVSGKSPRYVRGPGGAREDAIPALLSDGEYVIDRETLALLGDGSSEDGARKLDAMRENIRAHKGKALAKGKISPDAKAAEYYLGGRV